MKRSDLNDVLGLLFMIPLIFLIWVISGWLAYEIISSMLWR